MSKPKELLEKLKQRKEEGEAVCAYWAEVLPGLGAVPEAHLQSWLGTYGFDDIVSGIDAAVIQRSKRLAKGEPMDAGEAVLYASATMRDLRYRSMSEEEQQALAEKKAEISAKRSAAGKIGRARQLAEGAKACQDFAQSCPTLPEVCPPLPNTLSFTVSGSGSTSLSTTRTPTGSLTDSSEAKPAAAVPPAPNCEERSGKPKPKTENPKGSGVSPNQDKPKTEKHSRRDCPKCGEPLYRDEPHACKPRCTCAAAFDGTVEHAYSCPVRKAELAAEYGNELGVPEL